MVSLTFWCRGVCGRALGPGISLAAWSPGSRSARAPAALPHQLAHQFH